MSERSSSILVGAFIVGTLVIAAVGALFIAGGGIGRERSTVVMVFDGSVHGLTVGAPVALRGVTIGQVTDIDLLLDANAGEVTMAVFAEINPGTLRLEGSVSERVAEDLVARGLRAQLNTQSLLTGLLYIQLDFHPETQPKLADLKTPFTQIPTIPTELEQLRRTFQTVDFNAIAANVDRIAGGLDTLLNSADMQALPTALRSGLESLEAASRSLEATLASSGPGITALLDESRAVVARVGTELPALSARLDATLDGVDEAIEGAAGTLARLEEAAAPDSAPRQQLSRAMQELELAARAVRSLARSLEEHPEALLRGRREDDE